MNYTERFSSNRAVNTSPLGYETNRLILNREINTVMRWQNHSSALCGLNTEISERLNW